MTPSESINMIVQNDEHRAGGCEAVLMKEMTRDGGKKPTLARSSFQVISYT